MAETITATESEGDMLTQIAHALHEMCQPLTVLQCRLEIDLIESEVGPVVTQTATACLQECERLNARVFAMRALVQRALLNEQRGRG